MEREGGGWAVPGFTVVKAGVIEQKNGHDAAWLGVTFGLAVHWWAIRWPQAREVMKTILPHHLRVGRVGSVTELVRIGGCISR